MSTLSAAELNDRCGSKCSYWNETEITAFCTRIGESPMDIEDLVAYGSSHHVCPYFSVREAISSSDIVLLPYQTLFHAGTRETLKLSLEHSYVVVDEAHNLVDALNSLYTVRLTKTDIQTANNRLLLFRKEVAKRSSDDAGRKQFKDKIAIESQAVETANATQLITAATRFTQAFSRVSAPVIKSLTDFQLSLKLLEGANPLTLVHWSKERRLVYTMCHSEKPESRVATTESCCAFLDFVEAMANTDDKGLILIDPTEPGTLTYLLLNPSSVFEQVTREASAVVLVGGTLRPFEDVRAQLTSSQNVFEHVNDHVIPRGNCLAMTAMRGPGGNTLTFTHETRNSDALLGEVASAIVGLCEIVPDGVIVFFTSFAYMEVFYKFLVRTGFLDQIASHKFLLRETKETRELEKIMRTFRAHIDQSQGAILFAVVNGKLSEGINFADRYCRGVMVVGMPFADPTDTVLKERMRFFDGLAASGQSTCNGQQFYLNLCMRAVNQSIGRSFRNVNDYATVILFDRRYEQHAQLLPAWIQRSYQCVPDWESILAQTASFFAARS
jgi:chromosome transmission fidelity protein 1